MPLSWKSSLKTGKEVGSQDMTSPLVWEVAHLDWHYLAKWLSFSDSTAPKASRGGLHKGCFAETRFIQMWTWQLRLTGPHFSYVIIYFILLRGLWRVRRLGKVHRQTGILITEGHAPLDNCSKRFYCKMRLGYFSSNIPLQSCSRVHLDNFFFHSRFTAIFATLGFVAWIAVLPAASRSTPPDFAASAARALPEILKSAPTLMLHTVHCPITSEDAFRKKKKKRKPPPLKQV